jgi:20S proteasome alpha/beta subunit
VVRVGSDKAITIVIRAPNILQRIISNDYTVLDNLASDSEMTLILGARCHDGVVLVADRKMTGQDTTGGTHDSYNVKIRGELDGILTAFSGDAGTFEVFANTLKDYVTTSRDAQIKSVLDNPFMGFRGGNFGPSFEQVRLRISQLQTEFNNKYTNFRYKVLMGVSSQFFADKKSSLYYFEADGRFFPLAEPKSIGSGSAYVLYFLKRYWKPDKTTMKEFAQLGDFVIRHVSHEVYKLDNAVGLSPEYPYPQIFFIPDNRDFCTERNNGVPKSDCSPTQDELNQYKTHSEDRLKALHGLPFYPTTISSI